MIYLPDTAVDLLRSLVRSVAAMQLDLAALRAGIASGADVALVGAVFAVAGERSFESRVLIAMAAKPGVPEQALQVLIAGRTAKGVGKLLRAAAGKPCDSGLVLTFEPGRSPNIWRVSHPRKPAIY